MTKSTLYMMGSRYYLLLRKCFQWQEFPGFLFFHQVTAETQEHLRKNHRQKQIKNRIERLAALSG